MHGCRDVQIDAAAKSLVRVLLRKLCVLLVRAGCIELMMATVSPAATTPVMMGPKVVTPSVPHTYGGCHCRWDAPLHKKLFVVKNFCIHYLNISERDKRKLGQLEAHGTYMYCEGNRRNGPPLLCFAGRDV